MEVPVLALDGSIIEKMELPEVFVEPYRPDLIKRSVLAAQANRRQPYGAYKYAGIRTSARQWGTGFGVARVPRLVGGRRGARVPQARGGRRAHPPKPEKIYSHKINKKERLLAFRSAIAATTNHELVSNRGHKIPNGLKLPIVVSEEVETLAKTREVFKFLTAVGLIEDVERAKKGVHVRAGKGKMRGRRYRKPKSLLFVVADVCELIQGARNLAGVDVSMLSDLSVEDLAPGAQAGRITVWSQPAIDKLREME